MGPFFEPGGGGVDGGREQDCYHFGGRLGGRLRRPGDEVRGVVFVRRYGGSGAAIFPQAPGLG